MTMSDLISRFSAAPAMTGYLYQIRYSLIESLRRLKEENEFRVSLETLDDVVFETQGEPIELLQTKHHTNRTPDLTDASPDLWKTIFIWCEGLSDGSIPSGTLFFLVTTAHAQKGTAAYYLKAGENRCTDQSLERLTATSQSSRNQTNKDGYAAFNSLSLDDRKSLLGSVYVVDDAPSIINIESTLRKEIHHAVELKYLDSFLQRLEGWWYRRMIESLSNERPTPIHGNEIRDKLTQLREQFKQDNLPIDADIMAAVVDESGYRGRLFVQQLELIEIGTKRVSFAIQYFFKASEQRSKWIREDLLLSTDLSLYEDKLQHEWEIKFEQMNDNLDSNAIDSLKKSAAKELYKWVEDNDHAPIRERCTEKFITRGTYQILSDDLRVGWHSEFRERLARKGSAKQ
jgi:hypothetical protein